MKAIFITFACLLCATNLLWEQHTRFTTSGTIEYEKSVNMNALLKRYYGNEMDNPNTQAALQIQKTLPQFKVMKSHLVFNKEKTLFTPVAPETMSIAGVFSSPMANQLNTVFTDLVMHTSVIQKSVSDADLLIKDTVRKIKWKITDETRDIAGYPCRRANALVLDSIYVVAFYTDKIPVSGGPESFGGLSGMILELAIPHENVTWKAVKITDAEVQAATILPPKKGKAMNNKEFYDFLKNMYSNWNASASMSLAMKGYML
jgi:GLPGLI family protein